VIDVTVGGYTVFMDNVDARFADSLYKRIESEARMTVKMFEVDRNGKRSLVRVTEKRPGALFAIKERAWTIPKRRSAN